MAASNSLADESPSDHLGYSGAARRGRQQEPRQGIIGREFMVLFQRDLGASLETSGERNFRSKRWGEVSIKPHPMR
jgi:hypothetical protein